MTKEEKELLLKDLSARLFYNVIVKQYSSTNGYVNDNGETIDIPLNKLIHSVFERNFLTIRPYLRPMDSMTKEERDEYTDIKKGECNGCVLTGKGDSDTEFLLVDWLNAHHFDYRGLIERGLALEAPEGMYRVN